MISVCNPEVYLLLSRFRNRLCVPAAPDVLLFYFVFGLFSPEGFYDEIEGNGTCTPRRIQHYLGKRTK